MISTRYYEKQEKERCNIRSEEMNHKENGFSFPPYPSGLLKRALWDRGVFSVETSKKTRSLSGLENRKLTAYCTRTRSETRIQRNCKYRDVGGPTRKISAKNIN